MRESARLSETSRLGGDTTRLSDTVRPRGTVRVRDLVRRIEAATPPGRDRAVDGLRAVAILGVVLGHWLVTALVADSGTLRAASPLLYQPGLTPVSWVFQTLAVFFLVGGQMGAKSHDSARARGITYRRWLRARLARLFRPVAAVLTVWVVAAGALLGAGVSLLTVYTLLKLALSPLWFLLVYAVLTAATPLVARLHPLWPLAVVLHVDLIRFGFGGPAWLGWVNLAAGWLVPYCLGAVWGRGRLRGRTAGWVLLSGGAAVTAGLVLLGGYPAAMVGVPGAAVSNLNPPTLAAVTFGLAQCGAALLLRGPLRRVLARPAAWAVVALVNLAAMTVFLWHQTAMMAVSVTTLRLAGPQPGLHTVPEGPGWVLARLCWLPVFAGALLICWAAFHAYEAGRPRKGGGGAVRGDGPGVGGGSRVVREGRPGKRAQQQAQQTQQAQQARNVERRSV
ncbi:acyltransferase family protein [Streptomyces rhizosphaericus]|uniref:Acyltransferase n=1 Tax=Streptomyces rhizosphaericus TaxID=114699 RepID=A0A6G4AX01_9ACTN|nr:acyltransferase [Streptomyces rhizosphaericus]NEW77284.1 acyltransferase [Streptomyces rhizosphaericus]